MSYLPPLPPSFEAALRDRSAKNPRHRLAAAARLGSPPEGRESEAAEALVPLLDDPMPAIRQTAIASLGHLRDASALDVILQRFDDPEPGVRQTAVIAVAEIGDARAAEPLERALADERADVRFQAVVSFAQMFPNEALDAVAPLLDDEDAEVRANAAAALGALGDRRACDRIARLLDDAHPVPQREAALALGKLGDARASDVLRECLRDPDRAIDAALALGRLHAEDAREDLARVAGGIFTSLHLKAAAGAALAQIGDARGVEALRAVLRAFRHDGRSFAAELVGELGIVDLAPELAELAARPRGADPAVVQRALERLAPLHGSHVPARDLRFPQPR